MACCSLEEASSLRRIGSCSVRCATDDSRPSRISESGQSVLVTRPRVALVLTCRGGPGRFLSRRASPFLRAWRSASMPTGVVQPIPLPHWSGQEPLRPALEQEPEVKLAVHRQQRICQVVIGHLWCKLIAAASQARAAECDARAATASELVSGAVLCVRFGPGPPKGVPGSSSAGNLPNYTLPIAWASVTMIVACKSGRDELGTPLYDGADLMIGANHIEFRAKFLYVNGAPAAGMSISLTVLSPRSLRNRADDSFSHGGPKLHESLQNLWHLRRNSNSTLFFVGTERFKPNVLRPCSFASLMTGSARPSLGACCRAGL